MCKVNELLHYIQITTLGLFKFKARRKMDVELIDKCPDIQLFMCGRNGHVRYTLIRVCFVNILHCRFVPVVSNELKI